MCDPCKQPARTSAGLSSTFGKDFTEKLIYGIFNPDAFGKTEDENIDLEQMMASYMDNIPDDVLENYIQELVDEARGNWLYRDWLESFAKKEVAREKTWRDLIERIGNGSLKSSNIPMKEMLRSFNKVILESLAEEGLLNLKMQKHHLYPKVQVGYAEFTLESEQIIAKKVLDEAFKSLEAEGFGIHEVNEGGYGNYPSNILTNHDEYLHTYDMLDIQETLVSAAFRDPRKLSLTQDQLKSRIPLRKVKSANIILLDISYSMHGIKFKGGMMATLALRQLLEDEFKEDVLHVVAYNDEAFSIPSGEALKLKPHGNTDIGRAIDLSVQMLAKEDGNKNIFLITDSEPTASYNYAQTPEENAYRATYLAGKEEIRLNIIMLDRKPELRRICERMATLNGNAAVTYVENPLNLKEFMIKMFVNRRRKQN